MLGTPTLFQVPTVEYLMSLIRTMNLLMQQGHYLDTCFVGGDAFVAKARNGIVQSFIESWATPYPADVLLFIDDDQSWEPEAVLRIIQDPHEIIGVAIPKKMDAQNGIQTFNNVMLDTDAQGSCFVENGLLRISQIGSGFLAIKRSAVEKVIKANPRLYSPGDGGNHAKHYNLFEAKIMWGDTDEMYDELVAAVAEGNMDKAKEVAVQIQEGKTKLGQFWGEDLIFCKKWVALGEKMWLDPNVTVSHVGRKAWSGNFVEFLQKHAAVELSQPQPKHIPSTLEAIERLAA